MKQTIKHNIQMLVIGLLLLSLIGSSLYLAGKPSRRVVRTEVDVAVVEDQSANIRVIDDANPPAVNDRAILEGIKHAPGTELTKEMLEKKLEIDEVAKEYVYYPTATTPNDPIYPQWFTSNISAPEAWDITTGVGTTTVAVIDTAFALDHEDLINAWHINAGEQGLTASGEICWTGTAVDKQTNGCDDDSNGYVDDWRGFDFSNYDNSPQTGEHGTGNTHGTKVSGLVGARGNNSLGIAAPNWNTQIMPLQGLFDDGYGYTSDIAAAIIYAVDNGADVVNLSLGSPYADPTMEAAIEYAYRNNVIVVASAGNCGADQSTADCVGTPSPGGMGYPGRFDHVIGVGAVTSGDIRASFSSYGPELDVVAPGSGTIQTPSWSSTNETSLYSATAYGTSFSAPITASVVSLIKGLSPGASFEELYSLLQLSADKPSGMGGDEWHSEYGYGRINAFAALQELEEREQQLTKIEGVAPPADGPPRVATNSGHTSATAISGGTKAKTVCTTSPGVECTIRFRKQGTSTVVVFDTQKADTQGIAMWEWDRYDVGVGTWEIYAKTSDYTSSKEIIYIK